MSSKACEYPPAPHQLKKALSGNGSVFQIRLLLTVFVCVAVWSLLLYIHVDSTATSKTFARLATYADSIVVVRRPRASDNILRRPPPQPPRDPCRGKYVYVHDLPSEFNDDIVRNCSALGKWSDMCKYVANRGFGPAIPNARGSLQDSGWFNTNQFLLEVIFRDRMRRYRCLTNDSAAASAVFVPYYPGLDVGRYLWGFDASVRDATPERLARWLSEKPEWKRMWGRDHFLVMGRISWDFRRPDNGTDWGNKMLLLPEIENMTVLGIEVPFPYSVGHEFAVPYPTFFHPSNRSQVHQWQERMRRVKRQHLFSFAGAPRPDSQNSNIRGAIISQCETSPETCSLFSCEPGTDNKCEDPPRLMELFQNSTFCLQPPGDSFTRRSIFDSIISGCIPVFFHPASAHLQYVWHFPKHFSKYSVFIPEADVRDGRVRIEDELLGFSKDEILEMREEVIRLIPGVLYADPASKSETMDDAFDIAVGGVLERVAKLRWQMKE